MTRKIDFDVAEMAAYAGLSRHMVDYLCRHQVIVPVKRKKNARGVKRMFRFADLVLLRAIKRLLEKGISVQRLRKAINRVRLSEEGNFPERYLVTDGEKIYCVKPDVSLEDISGDGQFVFGFVLDTDSVKKEVENAISELPKIRRRRASARA